MSALNDAIRAAQAQLGPSIVEPHVVADTRATLAAAYQINTPMSVSNQKLIENLSNGTITFSGTENNSNGHVVSKAFTSLARQCLEKSMPGGFKNSEMKVLIVGATAREISAYSANPNFHFYLHGKQGKDAKRIMIDGWKLIMERMKKKNKKKTGPHLSSFARITDLQDYVRKLNETDQWPARYHRLPVACNVLNFQDTIYYYNAEQLCDLFMETGATLANGYAHFPFELLFDDFPAQSYYRMEKKVIEGEPHYVFSWPCDEGGSYFHPVKTWKSLYNKTGVLTNGKIYLEFETVARFGSMVVFNIYKSSGAVVVREIEIKKPERWYSIFDLHGSVNPRTYELMKEKRISVDCEIIDGLVNYAYSLNEKSLSIKNLVMLARRQYKGHTLLTQQLSKLWDIEERDLISVCIAVWMYVDHMSQVDEQALANIDLHSWTANWKWKSRVAMAKLFWPITALREYFFKHQLQGRLIMIPEHNYRTSCITKVRRTGWAIKNRRKNVGSPYGPDGPDGPGPNDSDDDNPPPGNSIEVDPYYSPTPFTGYMEIADVRTPDVEKPKPKLPKAKLVEISKEELEQIQEEAEKEEDLPPEQQMPGVIDEAQTQPEPIENDEELGSQPCYIQEIFKQAVGENPKQVLKCHHCPITKFEVVLTEPQKVEIIRKVKLAVDACGIPKLKEVMEGWLKSAAEVQPRTHTIECFYIFGGPGAGKTHTIISIMQYLIQKCGAKPMVASPFTALMDAYCNVPDGKGGLWNFNFKTPHRMLDVAGVTHIIVDEMTSLDYDFLRFCVLKNSPVQLYFVGDTKQCKILPAHGTYIGDHLDFAAMNKHELVYNFRMPQNSVMMINELFDYNMVWLGHNPHHEALVKADPKFEKDFNTIKIVSLSEFQKNNLYSQYACLFFTHNSRDNFMRTAENEVGSEKYTVKANQGMTYKKVALFVTNYDKDLCMIDELRIVALSRHEEQLVIVIGDGPVPLAFLDSIKITRYNSREAVDLYWKSHSVDGTKRGCSHAIGGPKATVRSLKYDSNDHTILPYIETDLHIRNGVHWGQRKLLVSELDFLERRAEGRTQVIYLGAASGIHLVPLMHLMQEKVERWHLIDPASFVEELHKLVNVEIHNCLATVELVQSIVAAQVKGTKFLIISDIRSATDDVSIEKDMILQREICRIVRPDAALLKFRLAFRDGETHYFDGKLHMQCWAPEASTELRLEVWNFDSVKKYENKLLEGKMNFHNTYTRGKLFEIGGYFYCHDCACEYDIFLAHTGGHKSTKNLISWVTEMLGTPTEKRFAGYDYSKPISSPTQFQPSYDIVPMQMIGEVIADLKMPPNQICGEAIGDGDCLYHSIAQLVHLPTAIVKERILVALEFLAKAGHTGVFFEQDEAAIMDEINRLRKPKEWGESVCVYAACVAFRVEFLVRDLDSLLRPKLIRVVPSGSYGVSATLMFRKNHYTPILERGKGAGGATVIFEENVKKAGEYIRIPGQPYSWMEEKDPTNAEHVAQLGFENSAVSPIELETEKVLEPRAQTGNDAYLLHETVLPTGSLRTDELDVIYCVNEFGSQVPTSLGATTSIDSAEMLVPINDRGHPKAVESQQVFRMGMGNGNHFVTGVPAATVKIMLERYDKQQKKPKVNPHSKNKVKKVWQEYKQMYKIRDCSLIHALEDDAMLARLSMKVAQDIHTRHYFERIDGNGETIDLNRCRFHIKNIFKPEVLWKPTDINKAGQGICDYEPFLTAHHMWSMRVIILWDQMTDRKEGDHIAMTDHTRTDPEFLSEHRNAIKNQFGNGFAQTVVSDTPGCDVDQGEMTRMIVETYMEVMFDIEPKTWRAATVNWVEPKVVTAFSSTKRANAFTSGALITLLNNGIVTRFCVFEAVDIKGKSVLAYKGDDILLVGSQLFVSEARTTSMQRFTGMRTWVKKETIGAFCGMIFHAGRLYPDILRSLNKLSSAPFRDYKHFAEYQISLRDRVRTILEIGEEDVMAVNAMVKKVDFSEVQFAFDVLKSYCHISKQQYEELVKPCKMRYGFTDGEGKFSMF